ncbi:MAG: hypothetical protein AAF512_26755 [Pseudomonadota bacterium]
MKNSDKDMQTAVERERAQWQTHLAWFIRRVTSAIPFDVPVIDLDKYGLTPVAVYSALGGQVQFSADLFEDVYEPLVIFQQTIFWTLHQTNEHAIERIGFRMAAYNRRNRCHLHLKIQALSELGEPAEVVEEIVIDCMEVVDNNYFTVYLNQPLPAGNYRCELHAPDSDVENAVALFVAVPSQPVEYQQASDEPKPLNLPTAEQYREWYLHYAGRDEVLAEQRDEIAQMVQPPLLSVVLAERPDASNWSTLQESLTRQAYPYWECLSSANATTADERFKPLGGADSVRGEWVILLEPGVSALDPRAF